MFAFAEEKREEAGKTVAHLFSGSYLSTPNQKRHLSFLFFFHTGPLSLIILCTLLDVREKKKQAISVLHPASVLNFYIKSVPQLLLINNISITKKNRVIFRM